MKNMIGQGTNITFEKTSRQNFEFFMENFWYGDY